MYCEAQSNPEALKDTKVNEAPQRPDLVDSIL